jgi:hypothetical protein
MEKIRELVKKLGFADVDNDGDENRWVLVDKDTTYEVIIATNGGMCNSTSYGEEDTIFDLSHDSFYNKLSEKFKDKL